LVLRFLQAQVCSLEAWLSKKVEHLATKLCSSHIAEASTELANVVRRTIRYRAVINGMIQTYYFID